VKTYRRNTRETRITLTLGRPDSETVELPTTSTGEPFLDHMLQTWARYSGLALAVQAAGDLRHHMIEDVGITLGLALKDQVPQACRRYGHAVIPMDDALVQAAIDIGGRAYYEGRLPSSLYDHFLRSFAENAAVTLHVRVLRGRDRHHIVEAAIKATALALRDALVTTDSVFSTKGTVEFEREQPQRQLPGG
jgi:imidazoleglycerol-phosphate dehydratase